MGEKLFSNPRTELRFRRACLLAARLLIAAMGAAALISASIALLQNPIARTILLGLLGLAAALTAVYFLTWAISPDNKERIRELEQDLD